MTERSVLYQKGLYDPKAVSEAAGRYQKICRIDIKEGHGGILCVFHADEESLDLIIHEFDNYLIEMMNRGQI